jgi:TonB family protein
VKTCPTCGNGYSDELSYCLQDGTLLRGRPTSELSDRPTEVYRGQGNDTDLSTAETVVASEEQIGTPAAMPTAPPAVVSEKRFHFSAIEPASRMGCSLTIGQVATALVVVVGLGLVGLYISLNNSSSEVAMMNKSAARNANSAMPVPMSNATSNATSNAASTAANVPFTPADTARPVVSAELDSLAIDVPVPAYPPAARAAKAAGKVTVEVEIDDAGRVVAAKAVAGHPLLTEAALSAARSSKFRPKFIDGGPVPTRGTITYNFAVKGS